MTSANTNRDFEMRLVVNSTVISTVNNSINRSGNTKCMSLIYYVEAVTAGTSLTIQMQYRSVTNGQSVRIKDAIIEFIRVTD